MKRNTIFDYVNFAVISVFSLFCMMPMLLTVFVSITDEKVIKKNGYSFFPEKFSLEAYKMIFSDNDVLTGAYLISIFIAVAGTALAVLMTGMAGYALSNRQVKYRNPLALVYFITMIFNPGLVPWYMVCSAMGLKDNLLALIIPRLVFSPFNMFLVRNFMNGIPDSLSESAKIDGANDAHIAFKIYFPLSLPVLATIALFYGLGYWNDWFNAVMLVENKNIYPLQFLLFRMQSEIRMLERMQDFSQVQNELPAESFKMATVIITVGPIIFLYPYLQKYFIKGLIVGSVKG